MTEREGVQIKIFYSLKGVDVVGDDSTSEDKEILRLKFENLTINPF